MIIEIKVIPGAKKNFIKPVEGQVTKVYVRAPAVEGKANAHLVAFLADHFAVRKSQIEIIKGLKSRFKTIKISD